MEKRSSAPTRMNARLPLARFVAASLVLWLLMIVVLVVVPDWLERWLPLEASRVIGWAVAMSFWVVGVEHHWKMRFNPVTRFVLQLVLWVTAALIAIWISDQTSIRGL